MRAVRLAALGVFLLPAAVGTASAAKEAAKDAAGIEFTDARADARRFLRYFRIMKLTAEQEKVKEEALSAIPAPCCSDYTMATCCCTCNLAKSVWGLSHYLITRKGYGAEQVRSAVKDWLAFTNKAGYSGKSCYEGGCIRPFSEDGCGGMNEEVIR